MSGPQQLANRRPGIATIEARLRSQHPNWTKNQVQAHAKVQWHEANRPSHHNLVASQATQPLAVSSPVGGRIGGDAPIVVQIYALGIGVTIKGQGGNLLVREGSFELKSHQHTFIFDPLLAGYAYGVVTPTERNVAAIFLSPQRVDQEHVAEFKRGAGHSGSPLKTTILYLPPGYGKTTIAPQLANKLGCNRIVDEWYYAKPIKRNALHLTNESPYVEVAA